MNLHAPAFLALVGLSTALSGCASMPVIEAERTSLHQDVQATIARFRARDPGLEEFFETAHGYAVFPTVGKGAFVVGGAHGIGEVIEQGEVIGYCDLTQGTIGLQLGGQAYSEIIFFERPSALDQFRFGKFALAAQASAVLVTAGASVDVDYERGVAVFTLAKGGLMAEAAVGGQNFTYQPK